MPLASNRAGTGGCSNSNVLDYPVLRSKGLSTLPPLNKLPCGQANVATESGRKKRCDVDQAILGRSHQQTYLPSLDIRIAAAG